MKIDITTEKQTIKVHVELPKRVLAKHPWSDIHQDELFKIVEKKIIEEKGQIEFKLVKHNAPMFLKNFDPTDTRECSLEYKIIPPKKKKSKKNKESYDSSPRFKSSGSKGSPSSSSSATSSAPSSSTSSSSSKISSFSSPSSPPKASDSSEDSKDF